MRLPRGRKDIYERARQKMLDEQIIKRGITQKEVLFAMQAVPRHLFVDEALQSQAYSDHPLSIGERQTISQPYIVALMTESLCLTGTEKVLEIGTGSGYQAAVLSVMAEKVYTVERISRLADRAMKVLDSLYCSNIIVRIADGTLGWPHEAPFDAILAAAGSPQVPQAYIEQLKPGGRLVMPVGDEHEQELVRITRREGSIVKEVIGGCKFVKLIGRHGWETAADLPATDAFGFRNSR